MSRADEPSACTAIVLAGGDRAPASLRARLPHADLVIAADGGLAQAAALGLTVDVVVGDFDSVKPDDLAAAEDAGARVERHPAAKEHTDLELALIAARDRAATRVVVVGAWGGRVDHELANLLLLGSDDYASLALEAIDARGRVIAVRDTCEITGAPGDLVTLLAVGGAAKGVRTTGLRYPLHGETLAPGSSRGVSNELVETVATVSVATGVVLVVAPDTGVV
ncbi:MAG TPA: thiamine diphosphokinase [Acidimicrobiia bacterium]|jgi:thiamine pyrophosphokinase|nr:thiamine diphosphokinase [Acidimicrobiia bacterium]